MGNADAVKRVLSLGAGVQSTTVLLMSDCGDLPRLDAAVFADTQWEPAEVYDHLDRLTAAVTIPVIRVTRGNLRADVMRGASGDGHFTRFPYFIDTGDGQRGMGNRDCTRDYKARPVRRAIRQMMTDTGATAVEQWFGISLDEIQRMKTPDARFLTYRYPLVDLRMTRHDCHNWLARHGWTAPRSACVGCPYHSDHEWRRIKTNADQWADAVEVDATIRRMRHLDGAGYLHASLRPLADVDLSTPEDHGQLNLFDQECEGMCGV